MSNDFTRWKDPNAPKEYTQAEIAALPGLIPWGSLILNGDEDQMEMKRRPGDWSGVMTFADHLDEHNAIIDDTYQGSNPAAFGSIKAAIDAGKISIFVNSATEIGPFTIAQGDAAQRIQGKDADTTLLPQNLTVQKNAVTIEQLALNGKVLTISNPSAI